jgi:hypothetical protein
MRDRYKEMRKMDRVNINMVLERYLKGYLRKELKMVQGRWCLLMVIFMKGCGRMG